MAKKKAKKKVSKKKSVRKPKVASRKVKKSSKRVMKRTPQYNSRLALRDLILFALLSVVSFMLYTVSGSELYQDMFYLVALLFGFISVAFLIVYLILIFSRGKVKKY